MKTVADSDGRHGASPDAWEGFAFLAGLQEDLLPVISNPKATISPNSSMQALGKTPSWYNRQGHAVGIAEWTKRRSTAAEIAAWAAERDYGICIQTRLVVAIDVDVTNKALADRVMALIQREFHGYPVRTRPNSSKFLVAFTLPGKYTKRKIPTEHGIIEFLATGQQFIAAGRHPSGVFPEWWWPQGEYYFPTASAESFENIWSLLQAEFGVAPATESRASIKVDKLREALANDPVAQHLLEGGHVLKEEQDGRLHITCPFEEEHTSESGVTSTTYWPAHTGGYERGHFRCLHAHCEHRTDTEYLTKLGYRDEALVEKFYALTAELAPEGPVSMRPEGGADNSGVSAEDFPDAEVAVPVSIANVSPFPVLWAGEYASAKSPGYHVKGVLPRGELAVVYGPSTSGKTFVVIDILAAVARGIPWRGHRTKQEACIFVAAEAPDGIRGRLQAYCQQHQVDPAELDIGVICRAPNLLDDKVAYDLARSIIEAGKARGRRIGVVAIDTLAAVNQGGNENDAQDMSKLIHHCKLIHLATGATVILIHHTGKDVSKGARGSSVLKAATDAMLAIDRTEELRSLTVEKLKDGRDGGVYWFNLATVTIGIDEDDEEITSCYCQEAESPDKEAPGGWRTYQTKGVYAQAFLAALREISAAQTAGIEFKDVVARGMMLIPPPLGGSDRRAELVRRAGVDLANRGLFAHDEGVIDLGAE